MYVYSKNKKFFHKIVIAIIVILGVLGAYKLIKMYSNIEINDYNVVSAERLSETVDLKSENSLSITEMLEKSTDSVVGISKLKENGSTIFTEHGVSQMGIGSGVIISEKGYILTNEHVSGPKNSTCYVTMEDGKNYSAKVVWSDSNLDLAIIKINMKCVSYAKLGDSSAIRVGEGVYAIGNPIGFEFQKTVTSGIVSATDRTILFKENTNVQFNENGNSQEGVAEKDVYMSNLIQTDATINPGNSGGPLINSSGEVIGINTVKVTSAEGIGFAVPINVIKPILEKLENSDSFDEASIGIFAYDKKVIPYLDSNIEFDTGIYVAQITLDYPAYKSGLEIGDVITKIDEKALERMCDLREYIYSKSPGDMVKLTVMRNNRERLIDVELSRK